LLACILVIVGPTVKQAKPIVVISNLNNQQTQPSVLRRIADGDSTAVNDCIRQYGARVWGLARRLSRTQADAEDATQEIFLNIWHAASSFDPAKGCESAFILMIARRRLIDRLRKSKFELSIDSTVDVAHDLTSSEAGISHQSSAEAEMAMGALRQLRPDQRRLLELNLLAGLTQAEISAQLDLPLGTVKSHIRRGLMTMRQYMRITPEPGSSKKRRMVSPVSKLLTSVTEQ
jgi:RNA polymerase sigma factor (sigma-70 family)